MSEQLSLSEELRRAREGRGETLDQVNQRTGISPKILQALEEGDLEAIEVVYLRLAAVHYGNYLGLDGHALAQELEGRRSTARVVPRLPRGGGYALGGLARPVVAVAVAGLLAVLYLVNDGPGDPDPSVAPAPVEVSAAPELSAADAAALSAAPGDEAVAATAGGPAGGLEAGAAAPPEGAVTAESTEVTAADTAAPAHIVLQADILEPVWVRVGWDDADSVSETIPGGEKRTWRAERFFEVHVGRSRNIRFRFQGQLLADGRLGEAGSTLRFRVSADGYQLLDPEFQPIGEVTGFQPERTESRQPGVR